jgi:hypothetical protein
MTNHLSFEQLSDLADGALQGANEQHARGHLLQCADCSARLADITALATGTAALPREVAPPADLWSDIKQQLKTRHPVSARRLVGWPMRHLAAAAVVIALGSSVLTALVLRGRQASTAQPVVTVATPRPSAGKPIVRPVEEPLAQLPARLASAEHRYSRDVDMLERTLAERRDSLAPSTVATVERSLRVADSAIAEARAALARDPGNHALAALFASNYERKIDLLRRATELAPRT